MNNVLLFTDVETGGLDCSRHSLLTVSFVLVQDNQIIETKEWYIKPKHGYVVEAEALKVNRIDIVKHDEIAKPAFDCANGIIKYLESLFKKYNNKLILAGQNTIFDINFIKEFMDWNRDLEKFNEYVSHRYVDIMSLAIVLNQNGVLNLFSYKLEEMIKYFNIEVDEKDRHTATGDAIAAFKVYLKLIGLMKL